MNYLAHLLLAQPNADSRTGNLMGDFLQGVDRTKLPPAIEKGIQNHIAVDAFTDSHNETKNLRSLFTPKYRRFAPIILDITYDYLLSQHWDAFCSIPRIEFIRNVEKQLLGNKRAMTKRMANVVETLIEHDVFNHYNTIDGLATALDRTAARLRTFYGAISEVKPLLPQIETVFKPFMFELQEFVAKSAIEK